MGPKKIVGIVLVIVGIGIAYTGYEMSGSVGNQLSSALGGSQGDGVMLRYVLGAACVIGGGLLAK